ncbi:FAD binding domain protein [Apiospora arundinis]|uniref:FAD binding domain protein n=1 Tax=Apiospora arundinis TaxID=335852 RepID=A0ABR2I8V2_9PEZI
MDALKLPMVLNITSFPTYYEHFDHYLGPMPYGLPLINIVDVSIAGRLIPRKVVEDPESNAAFIEALKKSVYPGGSFITGGVSFNAPHSVAGNGPSTNAVLPAWRDAILNVIAFAPWSYQAATTAQNLKAEDYLIDVTLPALKSVSPGGSAYLNEANLRQAD